MKTLPDEVETLHATSLSFFINVSFFIFEVTANACTVPHSAVVGIVSIADRKLAADRLSPPDAGKIVSSVVNRDKFGQNSMPLQ